MPSIRYFYMSGMLLLSFLCVGGWSGLANAWERSVINESYDGRDFVVYMPQNLPPAGARLLVIGLHGGLGNDRAFEKKIKMDAVAEKHGFIVAYLNGTPVGQILPGSMKGWNAGGGCCGVPFKRNVDDVGYIKAATDYLAQKYGIANGRIFVIGHSNGAMMSQRMLCTTQVFAAAVAISGPLNIDVDSCPAASGKRVLSIHGIEDKNVPVNGGFGTKGVKDINYKSEAYTNNVYDRSGASYSLITVSADHSLENIDAALIQAQKVSIAEKAASFFGL